MSQVQAAKRNKFTVPLTEWENVKRTYRHISKKYNAQKVKQITYNFIY